VLRGDWGFDGVVMSDWGAVNVREDGVRAGLDLEMPSSGGAGARRIVEAVRAGTLAEADVDRGVRRVLELLQRTAPALADPGTVDAAAHHALAREAAAASAVLLRNDGVLPLAATGGTIAVVGEFARTPRYQGAGSSQVNPTRLDDALGSLREQLAGAREVTFAAGYDPESADADPALVAEAVAAARAAEVVVLFLGLPASYESEGYDREHLNLPATQLELLDAVADANANLVVVLANGSVVAVEPWQERTRALLEGWLLGQAGGAATADLLLGRVDPSGRLAETLPVHYLDNPTVGAFPGELGHVRYGEGLLIGYRWYDAHALRVAHPFGHGLSYTTFTYSDLAVEVVTDGPAPVVDVRVTVTNTGGRAGTETVQVYVSDPEASVQRPEQELRGFARVRLEPGAAQEVTVRLEARAFAFWHARLGRWAVEGGEFGVRVGGSSRDVRVAATLRLTGEDVTPPLAPDSEVGEWLTHPVAGPALRAEIAGTGFEGMLDDPHNGQMMRAIPLVRLARFPGSPVAEDSLAERAAAANAPARP